MSILLDASTKVLAIAATGAYGAAQVHHMRLAGTNVVGFVSLGRGGTTFAGLPVFDLVSDAVSATGADTAAIYAPPLGVRAAVTECADSRMRLAVAFAENVPLHDTISAAAHAKANGLRLIGPNTIGIAVPGVGVLGSLATAFTAPGSIGLIGRSGTLTLTTARMLTQAGLGQSTLIHAGGDTVTGTNPDELVELMLHDPQTAVVAYLGEIGGSKEYRLAEVVSRSAKPVVALIVGEHAPVRKRMGHAGAMVESQRETAAAKRAALAEAGAVVCISPMDLVSRISEILSGPEQPRTPATASA
ncbi:MAG: succinate--CoA ligase subunit alpha [Lautropia sp.]